MIGFGKAQCMMVLVVCGDISVTCIRVLTVRLIVLLQVVHGK